MEEASNLLDLTFDDIIAGLLDSDRRFHPRYLYRLSDLASNEIAKLKQAWPSIPDWRRQALLEDLEHLYDSDTLLSFEAICRLALEDPNPQIRFLAFRSLQEYEVFDLIPFYMKTLAEDDDEEIRAIAATSLGKYVYLGEIEAFSKRLLKDIETCLLNTFRQGDSTLVHRRAMESLGYSSHPEVPRLIEEAYNTGKVAWIASALLAMGRSFDQRWIPIVLEMLVHVSPDIRFEAVRAAGELEITQAKSLLVDILEDEDRDVRMASVWALSQIGGEELVPIFENLIEESDYDDDAEEIEDALDNLIFNQSIRLPNLFDIDDADIDYLDLNEDEDQ
jgi:HEAT repeat protein